MQNPFRGENAILGFDWFARLLHIFELMVRKELRNSSYRRDVTAERSLRALRIGRLLPVRADLVARTIHYFHRSLIISPRHNSVEWHLHPVYLAIIGELRLRGIKSDHG